MSDSVTVVAGQQVPAVRSLRRRLWQALKDEDAATAARAYTCTRAGFEKWLAEETAEEILRLERMEEAKLRERMEKREARPAALKKLGSIVSIAKRGGVVNGQNHRRNPSTRKTTPADTIPVLPARTTATRHGKECTEPEDKASLLQLHMNPSEPFLSDDQKCPFASYEEPSQVAPVQQPTTLRRKRLVPRLAGFFGRGNRRNDSGSEDGSDDGSDKIGVDEAMTTPLHEACRIGCAELVSLMLANGGEPNFKNGKLRTALHMAAGGLTMAEEMFMIVASGATEQPRNSQETDSIGIRAPIIVNADDNNNSDSNRQQSGLGAKRAARAMGRFFKETLTGLSGSTKDKAVLPPTEVKTSDKFDMDLANRLQADRMDTCLAILSWVHSDDGTSKAGDSASINAVDYRRRAALHYAAELGRTNVCMAVLSAFGAILTIVDDNARTPCELAGERSHKLLAAQLEARALLFTDPEDDMLSSGFDDEHENEEGTSGVGHTRMTLVAPFSWFETLTMNQVQLERSSRISKVVRGLKQAVLDYNEAKDVGDFMYGNTSDDEDSVDGQKVQLSSKSNVFRMDGNTSKSNHVSSKAESFAMVGDRPQDFSAHESSQDADTHVLSVGFFRESHAEVFLASHGWNVEKGMSAIDDDLVNALREADIDLPTSSSQTQRSGGRKSCLICCEEFANEASEWWNLENCEHGFCIDCLGDYLRDCAVSRSGLVIVCPHHECSVHLSRNEIEKLAPEPETFDTLVAAANDHFVTSASDLKFCPHPGCTCVVKRIVPQFVKTAGVEEEVLDYSGAVCVAIDEQESGSAGTALTYEGVPDPNYSTTGLIPPKKAHRFCFACGEESVHWPVPCDALKAWEKKIEEEVGAVVGGQQNPSENFDDLAQRLWMKANTRPCPKCKAPIEKNDGCNHMRCSNPHCKHEFCWICRKDWKLHNTETGGFFRCNRWQGEDDHEFYDTPPPAEDRAPVAVTFELLTGEEDQARYGTAAHSARVAWKKSKEMSRFLHHYSRWNAHSESLALERKMEESVCSRIAPVVDAAIDYTGDPDFNFRGKGLSFVFSAFTELLECRSLLQHSYAFAFYRYPLNFRRTRQAMSRGREKVMFEQLQSELEMMTEQLSDIVARSHLRATQTQITYSTTWTAEKRSDFSNLMLSILNDERAEQRKKAERGEDEKMKRESESPITSMSSWLNTDVSQIRRFGYDDETPTQRALRTTLRDFLTHRDEETGYRGDYDDEYDTFRWTNWSCTACTYMNVGGNRCAMCGSLRHR